MARKKDSDGSELSGDTVDTAAPEQSDTDDTTVTDTAQADTDAGETAEQAAPDANESRTAFVTGVRPGDQCICPDGRTGTVHKFDNGLVCIPNHDQG